MAKPAKVSHVAPTPEQRLGIHQLWWEHRNADPIRAASERGLALVFRRRVARIFERRRVANLSPCNWTQLSAAVGRNRRHLTRAGTIPPVTLLFEMSLVLEVEFDALLPTREEFLPEATRILLERHAGVTPVTGKQIELYIRYLLARRANPGRDLDPHAIRIALGEAAGDAEGHARADILGVAGAVGRALSEYLPGLASGDTTNSVGG